MFVIGEQHQVGTSEKVIQHFQRCARNKGFELKDRVLASPKLLPWRMQRYKSDLWESRRH